MELFLNNKVIVVTGSARHSGADISRILMDEGAIIVMVGKNPNESLNSNMLLIVTDLKDEISCKNAIQAIIQKFGRIDGLINNPEEYGGTGKNGQNLFLENLQNNLVNYYLVTHFALPYLIKSKGAIINISTGMTESVRNTAEFAATSGGVNALTRDWAVELVKYGIRVNNIIVTGSETEIANSVAFFLSERSSHTTGQLIQVNKE